MATILVEKLCGCAKKRKNWQEKIECDSIEEAISTAEQMCEQGNTKFCKKHKFSHKIDGDCVNIIMEMNK